MRQQSNYEPRAFQAWNVLIKRAEEKRQVTYKELAEKVSFMFTKGRL